MKIFKFGGASVKDADSVRNVAEVLKKTGYDETFMVVSAMGKTTNSLEEVVKLYFEKNNYDAVIEKIKLNHIEIAQNLFEDPSEVSADIELFFQDLSSFLRRNKSPDYSFVYDQVVCCGELISTKIISSYLNSVAINNQWIDVRDYLKTDATYREGKVNWEETESNFQKLSKDKFYITQGFLGADPNYFTTTLGREGSDYTAAIIAFCLNAKSMTIWKDVPGVLNADPRYFEDTILLEHISYEEAIELAYYGASVIHPKTMQPLQNKNIPFFVKSFLNPLEDGTSVKKGQPLEPKVPCYILKKDQHLVRLSSRNFSFITEDQLSGLFNDLYSFKIKVNLMQNSAITLSLGLEDKYGQLDNFINKIGADYDIKLEREVNLYTVRHYDASSEKLIPQDNQLLKQTVEDTLQVMVKA